jgi:hypothetical protein
VPFQAFRTPRTRCSNAFPSCGRQSFPYTRCVGRVWHIVCFPQDSCCDGLIASKSITPCTSAFIALRPERAAAHQEQVYAGHKARTRHDLLPSSPHLSWSILSFVSFFFLGYEAVQAFRRFFYCADVCRRRTRSPVRSAEDPCSSSEDHARRRPSWRHLLTDRVREHILGTGRDADPDYNRLPDFEAYLSFVEHSIQYLQFVVWYQSYRERFFALPEAMQALSPVVPSIDPHYPPSPYPTRFGLHTSRTDETAHTFSSDGSTIDGYFSLPSASPFKATFNLSGMSSPFCSSPTISHTQQPFRSEIGRIVATFLAPNVVKSIHLPEAIQTSVVRQLAITTHPDVFAPAYDAALATLRAALPRFLAQSVITTNRPKQLFWFALAAVWLSLGLLVFLAALLGPSHGPVHMSEWSIRGIRLVALPLVFYGSSVAIMASKGSCAKVMKRGHMQLRPWELEAASEDTRTWWAGLTGVADTIPDEEETSPEELAEEGIVGVTTHESSNDVPVPLTLRARRQARRVRHHLLADLFALELPSLLKPKSSLTTPVPPVMISFMQSTTVVVDDSLYPTSPVGNLPLPSPKALAGRFPGPVGVGLPGLTSWSDDITLADKGSTGEYAKVTPPPSPYLSVRVPPSKRLGAFMQRSPTVFGPEKVVLDPRILAAHKRIKMHTTLCAVCCAFVSATAPRLCSINLQLLPQIFTAVCLAVPAVR